METIDLTTTAAFFKEDWWMIRDVPSEHTKHMASRWIATLRHKHEVNYCGINWENAVELSEKGEVTVVFSNGDKVKIKREPLAEGYIYRQYLFDEVTKEFNQFTSFARFSKYDTDYK